MTEDSESEGTIRVVALGVVRRERADGESDGRTDGASRGTDELLVERGTDPATGEEFYRPLGGGVEFGEHSEDALHREFREEIGVSLENVTPLETYENVFSYDGRTQHEVWRLYEASIAEDWPDEKDEFTGYEAEFDEEIECVWKSVDELAGASGDGDETFYPEPLLSVL